MKRGALMALCAGILAVLLLITATIGMQGDDEEGDGPQEGLDVTESSPASPSPLPATTTYISQEFLDVLEKTILEGTALEMLPPMVIDQVVTEEELETYALNPDVASNKRIMEETGGSFLKVDGDNDGIDDLFAWLDDGGSMGNNSRVFLKGQEDGSFECTSALWGLTQELAFVCYDETVYLLETHYDYNRKATSGFIVSLYLEGEVYETLSLDYAVESYEPTIIYQAAGYEDVSQKYAEEGRNGFWDENNAFTRKEGSAETKYEEVRYHSDFNNDGEEEWYSKSIFYPSNLSMVMSLNEALYQEGPESGEGVSLLSVYPLEYEGIPLYFWVDSVGEKQIFFLLCYSGLDQEMLYGYLIEGEQTEKVLEIAYAGIRNFEYRIYTRGINYERNPWW